MTTSTIATRERRTEGATWHRRVAGLHVLKLKGSFYEMGRQHGTLLGSAVAEGPVPYYRRHVERLVGRSVLRTASPLIWAVLHRLLGRRVARNLPAFADEAIRGLADGARMPLDEIVDGCTMPDALMWLASRFMRLSRAERAVHHRLALGLGCTSAIAWGDATVDGKLLHARNFDFHGVGVWPKTAAVIFHEPDRGQRYVSVAAAGVILGGVTAMNEAGLTLTVHQHMFTDRASLGGVPIGVVGDIVMREATNLDEAQAILQAHRPIGCWTYLVADGRRREVLCYEENPDRGVARRTGPDESTFGYANIYLDRELGASEVNLYGSYWRANQDRYRRANALLEAGAGQLDPDRMAAILGDVGDTPCRIRGAIAMLMTVGSVVFRPEDGAFWVAAGEAPASHHAFLPFDLNREDHAPDLGTLTGGIPKDETAVEAFEAYRRAFLAYLDERNLAESRSWMERARSLCPEQALYHAVAGLLALSAGAPETALRAFDHALAIGHADPERRAALHLWRARAQDLSGRRQRAEADYRAVADQPADAPVRRAARRGLRHPYRRRQARRIAIDFAFADVVSP